MHPDLEKYRADVQGLGLTVDQQDDLIHILWHITGAIADSEFGIARAYDLAPLPSLADCREMSLEIDSGHDGLSGAFAATNRATKF